VIRVGDPLFIGNDGKLTNEQKAASPIGTVVAVHDNGFVDVQIRGGVVTKFDTNKRAGWAPDNLQLMEESLETE